MVLHTKNLHFYYSLSVYVTINCTYHNHHSLLFSICIHAYTLHCLLHSVVLAQGRLYDLSLKRLGFTIRHSLYTCILSKTQIHRTNTRPEKLVNTKNRLHITKIITKQWIAVGLHKASSVNTAYGIGSAWFNGSCPLL